MAVVMVKANVVMLGVDVPSVKGQEVFQKTASERN